MAIYTTQNQALLDKFSSEERFSGARDDVAEISVELMRVPEKDDERNRLNQRKKELDNDRNKFTEAAVRLGREKAALEVCFGHYTALKFTQA